MGYIVEVDGVPHEVNADWCDSVAKHREPNGLDIAVRKLFGEGSFVVESENRDTIKPASQTRERLKRKFRYGGLHL